MTAPAAASTRSDGSRFYLIPDPVTGEQLELPNITGIVDVVHSFGLEGWKLRHALIGTAMREDIACQVVAAHHIVDTAARNQELRRLAKDAIDAGVVASKGRLDSDWGTGLHLLAEVIEHVADFTKLPATIAEWAQSYADRMAGVEVIEAEFTVLGPGYAGTGDQILRFDTQALGYDTARLGDGTEVDLVEGCFIADIKTGTLRDKSALQLAALANATSIWDADYGIHRELPSDLRRDVAWLLDWKADEAKLVPVRIDDGAWPAFLGAAAIKAFIDTRPAGPPGPALPRVTSPRDDVITSSRNRHPAGHPDPFEGLPVYDAPRPAPPAPTADPVTLVEAAFPGATTVNEPAGSLQVEAAPVNEPAGAVVDVRMKRRWLVQRIEALDPTGRATLARRWPPGVGTFKHQPHHDLAELEAIEAAIDAAEADVTAPFPDPDPTDPRLVHVPGNDQRLLDIHTRREALPADLHAGVVALLATQDVSLSPAFGCTAAQLETIEDIIEGAETIWQTRIGQVNDVLSIAGNAAAAIKTTLGIRERRDVTAEHAEHASLLLDGLGTGILAVVDGRVAVDRPADLLDQHDGKRRQVVDVAKAVAVARGWQSPRTFDDVVSDPLLTAAVLATT